MSEELSHAYKMQNKEYDWVFSTHSCPMRTIGSWGRGKKSRDKEIDHLQCKGKALQKYTC